MFWLKAAQVIVREEDCLSSKILGHFSAGSQLKAWLGDGFMRMNLNIRSVDVPNIPDMSCTQNYIINQSEYTIMSTSNTIYSPTHPFPQVLQLSEAKHGELLRAEVASSSLQGEEKHSELVLGMKVINQSNNC